MGTWNALQAQRILNGLHPVEEHNAGGDCMNPRCDYQFTEQDWSDIGMMSGWFTCPKCNYTYNYLDPNYATFATPGGRTRSGLTLSEMGDLGEKIIARMGSIPTAGQVIHIYPEYNNPIDGIVGRYGVEIKTIHSEAQPRFKLAGGATNRQRKTLYCQEKNLVPGMIGVRLNFYTSKADIFFRQGMADTWIGSSNMPHVATVDFRDINPFPDPSEVPPPSEMPDDDSDIPF
jgi:hypothetical protein